MEQSVAIKKLVKILGKRFGYRINKRAATPEEREAAKAATPALIVERDQLKEKRDARYKAILAGDVEYQELFAAHKAVRDQLDKLFSLERSRKITVGTSEGMFFLVKAEGDNWQEVVNKLTQKELA